MVFLKWLAIALLLLAVIGVLAGQLGLFTGTAPVDLGVHDSRLKPPSKTPNSVSSQAVLYPAQPQSKAAQIAPISLVGDGAATLERIVAVVERMPGARVVERRPDYLYVQFTTRLMKFVDDTEFWFDPASQAVQVRSASRVGHGDLGANRKRIETIRAALASTNATKV